MSRLSANDLAAYRTLAESIAIRLRDEGELRAAVEADPVAALVGEGLPESLVPLFLRETDLAGDVIGYMDELEQLCLVTNL